MTKSCDQDPFKTAKVESTCNAHTFLLVSNFYYCLFRGNTGFIFVDKNMLDNTVFL